MPNDSLIERQTLYRYIHYRIDFGLNESKQDVQDELPELVQYDINSGEMVFDFFNLGRRVDITGFEVVLNFKLPSGKIVTDRILDKNKQVSRVKYYTRSTILAEDGIVEGNIALSKNGDKVTSPVRFQFRVLLGLDSSSSITEEEKSMFDELMEEVGELKQDLTSSKEELDTYTQQQKEQFDTMYATMNSEFTSSLQSKQAEYDVAVGNVNKVATEFETNYNELLTAKEQEFDEAFNGFDMGGAFNEKFEKLEDTYAEDYADMKKTQKEIYVSTLTYRIVEDKE